jgi:FkbM family methyltransferase
MAWLRSLLARLWPADFDRLRNEVLSLKVAQLEANAALRHDFSTKLDALGGIIHSNQTALDSKINEERIFREEFSHGLKRELLADIRTIVGRSTRPLNYPGQHAIFIHSSDGHRVFLDPDEPFMTMHVMEHGEWEPDVRDVLRRILGPGGYFVDIGANVGLHTIFAAQRVGSDGIVIALEPHPRIFELLNLNVRINGFERVVHLLQAAASNTLEEVDFEYFTEHPGMSGFQVDPKRLSRLKGHHQRIRVQTQTLDGLIHDGRWPDLVKIDVEGFETQVMEGASGLLKQGLDTAFLLEWEPELAKSVMGPEAITRLSALFHEFEMKAFRCRELGGPHPLTMAELAAVDRADILFIREASRHYRAITAG